MVVFALRWENKRAPEYMRSVKERMSWSSITKPSDYGRLFLRGNCAEVKGIYVIEIDPLFPRFYLLPPVFSGALYLFGVESVFVHAPLWAVAVAGYILWQPGFHVWALKRGYKRQTGEAARVRRVSSDDALRRVLGWDKTRY